MGRLKDSYMGCMSCGGKVKMKSGGKWIQKAIKHPGSFTKQAQAAGMSVAGFRNKVLANKSAYSSTTVRRANLAKTLSGMRKGAAGMLAEATTGPGPAQKVRAMVTRAKYEVGSAADKVKGATNQAAGVIGSDINSRIENARDNNTSAADEIQARVSARNAERDKRRYERNVSSPTAPVFRGENLPGNRRAAIDAISENLNTKAEGRERRKLAELYYENLNKPTTQAELEKQRARLQSNAIIGPTGFGVGTGSGVSAATQQSVCPVTGCNGGRKGMLVKTKVQPLSAYRKGGKVVSEYGGKETYPSKSAMKKHESKETKRFESREKSIYTKSKK